jgi:adenylate kinase
MGRPHAIRALNRDAANSRFTSEIVPALSNLFSHFGDFAKIKLVFAGSLGSPSENLMNPLRSLNIEHVSPAGLMRQEISRRTPLGLAAERLARQGQPLAEEATLALLRRWFWTRKPDAGFALEGFPATLLQAKVFDEWLDARDERLHGLVVAPAASPCEPVVEHYRALGLPIIEANAWAA